MEPTSSPWIVSEKQFITNRRNFIRTTGLIAFAGASGIGTVFAASDNKPAGKTDRGLSLKFSPYDLQLRHTFTLSNSSRTHTPAILTCLEYDGLKGYGEASMPPYLGETIQTATRFLSLLNMEQFRDPFTGIGTH